LWTAAVAVLIGVPALGRSFWDAPPTRGLYRPTAYNLFRGETQIQFLAFASPMNPLAFFEFEHGVSDSFQFGMRPISALFGDVRLWGKYHVGTTGPVSLAIPFGAEILVPVPSWTVRGGWVLSWRVLPVLTLHPGFELSFVPAMGLHPYLGADLDLWTNLKLVFELDGEEPYVDVGLLAWLFGYVRLQVDTPLPTVAIRISVTGRF
jgi:hypothetical protein